MVNVGFFYAETLTYIQVRSPEFPFSIRNKKNR